MGRYVVCLMGICVLKLFTCTVGLPTINGCNAVMKPNNALSGFDDKVAYGVSVETCYRLCVEETTFDCLSFDYIGESNNCYMSSTNAAREPDSMMFSTAHDYYDVICDDNIENSGDGNDGDDDLECSRTTKLGKEYRGTVAKTVNGRTCQRWDSQSPHQHLRDTMFFNASGIQESASMHENYCRNPDGEPGGPWCYTTDKDVRWEYCDIRACEDECDESKMCFGTSDCKDKKCYSHPHSRCAPAFCDGCNGEWYAGSNKIECELFEKPLYSFHCKVTTLGWEYMGTANVTETGLICQRWDSQYPHQHSVGEMFTDGASTHENYCRNPDYEPNGPWCYTTDPGTRWEYCGIPRCDF